MKKTLVSVIVGAALGVVFVTSGTDAHASEADGVWTPRTVDQIKADVAKAKDNKYKIVWGDTLSGISQATNLTVRKLADLNKIANV
ncbi:LysM peptidoglycan-binding domain-containing protein, partial [Enterococcus gallinarum]